MDKIDLDAIIEKSDLNPDTTDLDDVKKCIKEAVHQALVLASKKATIDFVWTDICGRFEPTGVNSQSILDVEKLVFGDNTKSKPKEDPFGPGITDYL